MMSNANSPRDTRSKREAKSSSRPSVLLDEGFAEILAQAPYWKQDDETSSESCSSPGVTASNSPVGNDSGLRVRVVASLLSGGVAVGERHLLVSVQESTVTLRGYVPTKRQQQLAVHLVLLVPDVKKVIDYSMIGELARDRIELVSPWYDWVGRHRRTVASMIAMTFVLGIASYGMRSDKGTPVFPVAGEMRVEGKIPSGAFIVLHPVSSDTPIETLPRGVVGADGVFRIGTFASADGAPLGEYAITVEWRPLIQQGDESVPGPNVIPAEYGKPETSVLRVRVTSGENRMKTIVLSSSHRVLSS